MPHSSQNEAKHQKSTQILYITILASMLDQPHEGFEVFHQKGKVEFFFLTSAYLSTSEYLENLNLYEDEVFYKDLSKFIEWMKQDEIKRWLNCNIVADHNRFLLKIWKSRFANKVDELVNRFGNYDLEHQKYAVLIALDTLSGQQFNRVKDILTDFASGLTREAATDVS